MVFLRGWAALAAAAIVWTAAAGCSPGLSKSDADVRCNADQSALSACYSAAVFTQCESCFEQCGDSCDRLGTCPISYTCNAGAGGKGGSGSGSGGATSSSTGP